MDKNEAEIIADILAKADGGCSFCSKELLKMFLKNFPEHGDVVKEKYKRIFKKELELEKKLWKSTR